MTLLGLPLEDAKLFLPWVDTFFLGLYGEDKAPIASAAESIRGYFADVLEARRRHPADPAVDFVSYLLRAKVFDRPLNEDELLDICFVLVLAGLDTTRGQLGYLFHHLATSDDDRRRMVEDPSLIPSAVEECLRVYTIIVGDGRKVTRDIDFHGCPMKAGDMVWLSVAAANRDPRAFTDADQFVIDRRGNTHFGFAAGPHRCLGAHLARQEMAIAVKSGTGVFRTTGWPPASRSSSAVGCLRPSACRSCGRSDVQIRVDADVCTGHGRCYTLAPDLLSCDDVTADDVPPKQIDAAREAAGSCPEGAIALDG